MHILVVHVIAHLYFSSYCLKKCYYSCVVKRILLYFFLSNVRFKWDYVCLINCNFTEKVKPQQPELCNKLHITIPLSCFCVYIITFINVFYYLTNFKCATLQKNYLHHPSVWSKKGVFRVIY